MELKEKLECALMALKAMGNTERARIWYAKYRPDCLDGESRPTMQYSLSCFLMQDAVMLIEKEPEEAFLND